MAEEQQKKFDISKYVTAQDIVAAITAGVVAYIRNSASVDDQQQPAAGGTPQQDADFDPTIRVDHGRLDISDPNNWKDGGVVNMNGNEIHVFKAPDGSTIRVNPYQLQAAGGDPMKAAMNQFAAKVQNGEVDLDKMFSAGTTVTTQSGMPVTVNAPAGTNAQDAIAQVRRGMTVDPLGAQPAVPMDDSSLQMAQAALDAGERGSMNGYVEAMQNIKQIAGAFGDKKGSDFLSACGRANVPLTDIMKYAKMVQGGQTNLTPDDLFDFAIKATPQGGNFVDSFDSTCKQVIYSVLNQTTKIR